MSNPSKVVNALAPAASVYPPLTAYHMVLLESLDCYFAKLAEQPKGYSWFDIALAHVAFLEKGPALKATVEREGREWVNKRAMTWLTSVTPKDLRDLIQDIADHIERGMATAVAFDGEQKKTNADGRLSSVNQSQRSTGNTASMTPSLCHSIKHGSSSPPAPVEMEPSQPSVTKPQMTSNEPAAKDGVT